MNHKILVVDDEFGVRESLKEFFRGSEYSCITAENGKEATEKSKQFQPDLILLDLTLPDIHGSKICQTLKSGKETKHIPIIVITGDESDSSELQLLKTGANDYITKPLNLGILLERMKNVSENRSINSPRIIKNGKYTLNLSTREFNDGILTISNFTPKEFDLLVLLLKRSPDHLESKYLLEKVWGYNSPKLRTHTLDSHIATLRRKLGSEIGSKILTVYGIGYKFVP